MKAIALNNMENFADETEIIEEYKEFYEVKQNTDAVLAIIRAYSANKQSLDSLDGAYQQLNERYNKLRTVTEFFLKSEESKAEFIQELITLTKHQS